MVQQVINIGTGYNDGTADSTRTAFDKTNQNFTDLYTNFAALAGATFTGGVTAASVTTADAIITGGKVDGTPIGATTPSTGVFTALVSGPAAGNGVALQMGGPNSAIRDVTNGASFMYFDVASGGTSQGQIIFRSSSAFSERMRIDASGNLLVGTTNAGVGYGGGKGAALAAAGSIQSAVTGGSDSGVMQRDTGGSFFNFWWGPLGSVPTARIGAISTDGTNFAIGSFAGSLQFANNGTETARINTAGNLLIGTTSNFTGRLVVAGSQAATSESTIGVVPGSNGLNLNGDVAIYSTFGGTTITDYGPRRVADIIGGFNGGTWGTEYLTFSVGSNGTANDAQYVTAEKMRIDGGGNVMIGTTTPINTLTVEGGVSATLSSGTPPSFMLNNGSSTNFKSVIQFKQGAALKFELGVDISSANAQNLYVYDGVAGLERARFDANGNFLVGTTAPQGLITALTGGTTDIAAVCSASGFVAVLEANASDTRVGTRSAAPFLFLTSNLERGRFDPSGNFLVGTTSSSGVVTAVSPANGTDVYYAIQPNAHSCFVGELSNASGYFAYWQYNGTAVGSIAPSGTTGVVYNTTSDARLKVHLDIPTKSRIADILIHDFAWKSDGSLGRGVFAQEAAKVIPEAVTVGDDGDEVTDAWQVDYSKFVPDLIVEVQALRRRVSRLEMH